jgi:hypothetical protein
VVTTKADAAPQEPEFQQSPVFAAQQKFVASAVAEQPPTALPTENTAVTPEAPQAPQFQTQTVPAQQNLVFGGPQEPVESKVADTLAAANLNQAQALPAGSNVLQVPSIHKANGHGIINPPKTSFKTTTAGAVTINEGASECPTDAWMCELYQHHLGRMPTPAEVSVQQSQQRTFAELEEIIKSSEEAKAKQTQMY